MAIYEYSCKECGHRFQARRAMKDADAPIVCPSCGNSNAKRGLSVFFSAVAGGSSSSSSSSCGSCSSTNCSSCGSK